MRSNRMKLVVSSSLVALALAGAALADDDGATGDEVPTGHALQSHTDANTESASEADRPNLSAMMNLGEQQTKALQQELKRRGFYASRIDGILGDKTREALRKFQSQQGLPTQGGMNDATADALGIDWDRTPVSGVERSGAPDVTNSVDQQRPTSATGGMQPPKLASTRVQLSGLSAEQRKQLQQRLQELGFYRGAIDGVIGAGTRRAMAQFFQRQAELAAQGVVDDATMRVFGFTPNEVQRVSGAD